MVGDLRYLVARSLWQTSKALAALEADQKDKVALGKADRGSNGKARNGAAKVLIPLDGDQELAAF